MSFLDFLKKTLKSSKNEDEVPEKDVETHIGKKIETPHPYFEDESPVEENVEIHPPDFEESSEESKPIDNAKNFEYLDNIIHKMGKNVVLDSDIVLDERDVSEYPDGIKLDVDNLVIDGRGHSIDAKGKSRIFKCTGKNISIHNLTLKDGFSQNTGGAILNYGVLTIFSCRISHNSADSAGAIFNKGILGIVDSVLSDNKSNVGGGAINNLGKLTIDNTKLLANSANSGGAIHNTDSLTITRSQFNENVSKKAGGAIINNNGEINISTSNFSANTANDGGAINNNGEINISTSNFSANTANDGGAIYNNNKLIVQEVLLEDNTSTSTEHNCDDIFNSGRIIADEKFLKMANDKSLKSIPNPGRIYELETVDENKKSFSYLNDLIASKSKEIKLKNDIILDLSSNEEESFKDGIIIERDDFVIDGNGHAVNGLGLARIFHCKGNNITIKNISLKNGFTMERGGAIYNEGRLSVMDSELTGNMVKKSMDGGIIFNEGKLSIDRSPVSENIAGGSGIIINHYNSELSINNSTFSHNHCNEIIENSADKCKIGNCTFSANNSRNVILNKKNLDIHNSIFEGNTSKIIMENSRRKNGVLYAFKCSFTENNIESCVIQNSGLGCTVEDCIFDDDISEKAFSRNIINKSDLTVIDSQIMQKGKTIFNEGYVFIKRSPPDFKTRIEGPGKVETDFIPSGQKFDFGYLDKMIHESTSNEILLDEDIRFEPYEKDFYEGGIELDVDDLIIDGNNKVIDGCENSRIFIVTGKNITLKNLTFKNGYSFESNTRYVININIGNSNGGALRLNSKADGLTLINCKFINNKSGRNGGAIHNYGAKKLKISSCDFTDNNAEFNGGAIYDYNGELSVINSNFKANSSRYGGAVNSFKSELIISGSDFNTNSANYGGGLIIQSGNASINNATIFGNRAGNGTTTILSIKSELNISNDTEMDSSISYASVDPYVLEQVL